MQYTGKEDLGETAHVADINFVQEMNPRHAHGLVEAAHLYQEDSNGKVVGRNLIPRPTNNPLDPLIWVATRKYLAFAACSFYVFLSNYVSASASPILYPLAVYFNVDANRVTYLSTFNILFLGIGNLFWVPLSLKVGKRPVFIAAVTTFFAGCLWGALAKSWGSLLGARIIQGFGGSAAEGLGPAVIADIFFLHERGSKVGFYVLMVTGGGGFGGIFAGFITKASTDWRWVFWMDTILTATCLLLVILFLPETTFRRPVHFENNEELEITLRPVTTIEHRSTLTLWDALSVSRGYDKDTQWVSSFIAPFITLRYPAVIWGSLINGFTLGWAIIIQLVFADFFPVLYDFSGYAIGNIGYAALIGAAIGCPLGGMGSDFLVKFITKRRKGFFQPEFRLWALIPIFILCPIGLFLWAAGIQNLLPSMVPIVGWGILYLAICAIPAVAFTYVVDCYKPEAGECSTILVAFKNSFAFGISFAVVPWVMKDGFVKVAGYNLIIGAAPFLAAIPLYIFGQRLRQWTVPANV